MNIFEDLIEELKEENLLEETVTDIQKRKSDTENRNIQQKQTESNQFSRPENSQKTSPDFNSPRLNKNFSPETPIISNEIVQPVKLTESESVSLIKNDPPVNISQESSPEIPQVIKSDFDEPDFSAEDSSNAANNSNQAEFFKKRATDEVTSLQMVEHVLSGVERDFLKITPKLYDDLEVKKSLHTFLQFSQNINSPQQAQAEFQLMQETEAWYSALSQKDKNISGSYLRRYCETTRPILSAQALASLARFYRNAPFSEYVRGKFDLVMTRYFARETGGDIRTVILSRDEIIEKLNVFYAEWSSIPLYATDEEDESNIVLSAIKFEEFMTEADEAENLEDLIKNDFFNRLKVFKESTHENFFAPLVTATAIESNVRIGNRYLQLLLKELETSNAEALEEKYGELHEQIISEVVCKTIQIANVAEGKFADADVVKEKAPENEQSDNYLEFEKQDLNKQSYKSVRKEKSPAKSGFFKVNKWILAAALIVFLGSCGLYIWVEYFNPPPKLSDNVKTVNLENSSLKEFIQAARISGDMFYGIVNPNWDSLTTEKKEDFLRKITQVGGEKGFTKITLMNKQGRNVGYASPEKVEVYNP